AYPPFGYRGQLEEEHVPASQKLAKRQVLRPNGERRHLQRGELPDVVGVMLRDGPSYRRAPVVPDHRRLARAEVTYESGHVVNETADAVVLYTLRLVAQIVSAHVRRDDAEALGEGRQLMTPGVPALRKAVEQYDKPFAAPAFGVVQTHVADLRVAVAHGGFEVGELVCHL